MIPQRTLSGECEITTGAFSITKRPPVYTGESAALNVHVSFKFQGVDYVLPSGVVAEMYLRYPNTDLMTVAVEMEKSGNTASGVLSAEQTGVAGYPLLVIQLTDIETSSLIVACATAVKVSDVRGDLVIDSRAPSPSEIVYIGRSPYINPSNGHWMQWDVSTNAYVDTEVVARGLPATFTAYAETLPEGSDATASIEGTALNPVVKVGVPKGDKGNTGDTGPAAGFGTPTASVDSNVGTPSVNVTASGPATAKVFNFAFHNLKGQKGDTGDVASVNGQTGTVQLNDEHIPSTVDGKTNVEAVLSYHSQQIANLENICNRNAGFHNSIFRGKSLGNSLTTEQKTAIQNGTFDDLFIGDYWTIGGIDYVICHFDYYYNCSDSNINYHHVVVMPRGTMTGLSITLLDGESSGAYKWNPSNTTAGGYIASRMRTVIMSACDTIVKAAFGSGNVHAISELYPSAFVSTTDGRATSWAWTSTDLICDLCNETMVYGQQVWGLGGAHGQQGFEVGIDKWQLAIFRLYPAFVNTRAGWWLRSVNSASYAAVVNNAGNASGNGASYALGVRPRFLVS